MAPQRRTVTEPLRPARRDLALWLTVVLAGLALAATAVTLYGDLGSDAPPFTGSYRVHADAGLLPAVIVAAGVLYSATRPWTARLRWRPLLFLTYLASFAWLATVGLIRGRDTVAGYLALLDDVSPASLAATSVDDILRSITDGEGRYPATLTGHSPGQIMLWWTLRALSLDLAQTGLILTAIGALFAPLVLATARSACGPVAARQYAPILVLAPYAVWMSTGSDAVTATLTAAALAAATYASHRGRRAAPATVFAVIAGLLLAVAAVFAYIVAWMGIAMACLYFARRKPWHNLATALGVSLGLTGMQLLGFDWTSGLAAAYAAYDTHVHFDAAFAWWVGLSAAVVCVAGGPAVVASVRKAGNTPAWPFLVGAFAALACGTAIGIAQGGVERTWLPFFAWLAIAATAPPVPGGRPGRTPLSYAAAGAVAAIVVKAVLVAP